MYRPCLHCEGKKYDKNYCPEICTYGEDRKRLEELEEKFKCFNQNIEGQLPYKVEIKQVAPDLYEFLVFGMNCKVIETCYASPGRIPDKIAEYFIKDSKE